MTTCTCAAGVYTLTRTVRPYLPTTGAAFAACTAADIGVVAALDGLQGCRPAGEPRHGAGEILGMAATSSGEDRGMKRTDAVRERQVGIRGAGGYSLVEMMVALGMAVIVGAGLYFVFTAQQRSSLSQKSYNDLQTNCSSAMETHQERPAPRRLPREEHPGADQRGRRQRDHLRVLGRPGEPGPALRRRDAVHEPHAGLLRARRDRPHEDDPPLAHPGRRRLRHAADLHARAGRRGPRLRVPQGGQPALDLGGGQGPHPRRARLARVPGRAERTRSSTPQPGIDQASDDLAHRRGAPAQHRRLREPRGQDPAGRAR